MGRKSTLSAEQWIEIERRHVVDGESINALAAEFGVNESSIRRKIKPNKAESPNPQNGQNPLQALAHEKVRVDAESKRIAEQIAELPYAKQEIVSDLARKLVSISEHLGSAAEISAASAHRLSILANQQLDKVDDVNPLKSVNELQAVALLQKMANSSSEIGLNLLRANKDMTPEDATPTPVTITFGVKDARRVVD
jgi:transposase-like protein